jgi:hypothetical protein
MVASVILGMAEFPPARAMPLGQPSCLFEVVCGSGPPVSASATFIMTPPQPGVESPLGFGSRTGAVYGAIDMPWAKLVGQIAQAYGG